MHGRPCKRDRIKVGENQRIEIDKREDKHRESVYSFISKSKEFIFERIST